MSKWKLPTFAADAGHFFAFIKEAKIKIV